MEKLKHFYQTFKTANNKIYFLFLHKKKVLWLPAGVAFVFGVLGYVESKEVNGFDVINRSFGLFAFAWIDDTNAYLKIARFLAVLTLFFGAVTLVLSDVMNRFVIRGIIEKPYDLVVGLGLQNSSYLKGLETETTPTLIIEKDAQNPLAEQFRQRGFGVLCEDAQEAFERVDLTLMKRAVISAGEDSENIDIAMRLLEKLDLSDYKQIFIRVENRNLDILLRQNVLPKQGNVDLIIHSMYENMVKALFEKHSVLGNLTQIMEKEEAYSMVVVGDGLLAKELVFALSILSNLPNQNRLDLYLIAKDAQSFYHSVQKSFTGIEQIAHLKIHPISLDAQSGAFYLHKVWHKPNLTNIFIATEDEKQNLDIALTLQNSTYISQIAHGRFDSKVHFASFTEASVSGRIERDKAAFANFFPFASIDEASQKQNLIDQKLDFIAKVIHYIYKEIVYDPDLLIGTAQRREVERRWADIALFSDKLSSKMQSMHINTKLLALGLTKIQSTKSPAALLKANKKIFSEKLGKRYIDDTRLIELSRELAKQAGEGELDLQKTPQGFTPDYFPKKYDTLFAKLIRSEHNRWMSYHYLDGWSYNPIKNKRAKEHNCLKPLDAFDTDQLKAVTIFDIYSLLYLPNILASSGMEMVDIP